MTSSIVHNHGGKSGSQTEDYYLKNEFRMGNSVSMVQNTLHSLVQEYNSGCLRITPSFVLLTTPNPPVVPQDALIRVSPIFVIDVINQGGCSLNFTLPPFFSQFHIFCFCLVFIIPYVMIFLLNKKNKPGCFQM